MQPQSFQQSFGPQSERGPRQGGLEGAWMRHDRTPGREDDDFLVPVDPAIGGVISASTNRIERGWYPATKQEKNARIAAGIVGGVFGLLGGLVSGLIARELFIRLGLFALLQYDGAITAALCAGGTLFGAVLLVLLAWFVRWPQSTFVGKQGLMRYTRGLLFGPKLEVFRFDDASELKVQRTRRFVNGVYSGTFYDYAWYGPSGNVAFRIHGQYRDDGELASHDPVQFAFAAEAAWSAHRIQHFDRMIAQEGIARFQCGRDWIGIGRGFLELGAGGRTKQIRIEDTKDIHLEQGVLVIKEKDAKEGIFRSEGVHRFPVAALNDFRVFLVVLEEQTGVRFR